VTLGDIFQAVEHDTELAAFIEHWAWCNLSAFHSEARTPATEASELACIEIAKSFEWNAREAQEAIDVSGVGKANGHGGTHYGLDFTPVNQLVHLPVRLRPEMEIRNDRKKLGTAPWRFTLLEVLGKIYLEIDFYGNPEDRDRESVELKETLRNGHEGLAPAVRLNPPHEIQD
jgi:hypothetical protein